MLYILIFIVKFLLTIGWLILFPLYPIIWFFYFLFTLKFLSWKKYWIGVDNTYQRPKEILINLWSLFEYSNI